MELFWMFVAALLLTTLASPVKEIALMESFGDALRVLWLAVVAVGVYRLIRGDEALLGVFWAGTHVVFAIVAHLVTLYVVDRLHKTPPLPDEETTGAS